MADIDGVVLTSEELIQQLQTQVQQLISQMQHMQPILVQQNIPPPNRPNLDLPKPSQYSGNPLEFNILKIKLTHFLRGNFNTYFDNRFRVMCAGALLSGLAAEWYTTLLDPHTLELPHHYNLDNFLAELTVFFRGWADHGLSRTLPRRFASNKICIGSRNCIPKYYKHLRASLK